MKWTDIVTAISSVASNMRHHMRPAVRHARLHRKTMASRTVRTRGGHLVHRHAHHGQTGRR